MKSILALSLVTSSLFSMQLDIVKQEKFHIKPCQLFIPERLGNIDLFHSEKGFYVIKEDKSHEVKKYFTDPLIRNMSKKQLRTFLDNGYLSVNEMNDGEYSLQAKGRIKGGGPILGTAAYWTTKVICYGVMVAGVITMIGSNGSVKVRTGNKIKPIIHMPIPNPIADIATDHIAQGFANIAQNTTMPLASVAFEGATSVAISTGARAAAGPGISLVSKTINGAGYGKEAALITAAGVHTSGVGVVSGIETLATSVGIFFGMMPTP